MRGLVLSLSLLAALPAAAAPTALTPMTAQRSPVTAAEDNLPDLYRQAAARHGVDVTTLYRHMLDRTRWVNTHGQTVAWPWTVEVQGRRYQFKTRIDCFNWLLGKRGKATGITFGLDGRRLALQSRSTLWAELDVAAMVERSAKALRPQPLPQPQTSGKPDASGGPIPPVNENPALQAMIARVSRETGVDELLLHAVIYQESRYKIGARSPKGAMGLMQLMPGTARELGLSPAQYYDPYANLFGGATYLKRQIDTFGALEPALAAYNAGPNAVRKYRGVPPYRETRDYVSRISDHYRILLAQHRPAPAKTKKVASGQKHGKPQRLAQNKTDALQQAQGTLRRVALQQETPVLLLNPARGYD
nr:lytic transglycosylase domain-containing protein [uncultured Cardiobacterium sp.]